MKVLILAVTLFASFGLMAKELPTEPTDTAIKIDARFKEVLKDRDSFKNYAVTNNFVCKDAFKFGKAWCACARGNAKNSYGGYTGVKMYIAYFWPNGEIRIFDTAWQMGMEQECSRQNWVERDAGLLRQ